MEQFVYLLIFAVIGLINWLIQKSQEKREAARQAKAPERPPSPLQAPRPVTNPVDELGDVGRKFREALGLPDEAETPKPVARRVEAPPALPPEPPPPLVIDVPGDFEEGPRKPVILFERKLREYEADLERRLVETTPPPPPVVVPPPRPRPAPAAVASPAASPRPLDELLRSREGLRRAILVQEVLGTPKGLVF